MNTRINRAGSRRRKDAKGESSREASAESNDEPDTFGAAVDDDDDASITSPASRPEGALRPRDSFEQTSIPPGANTSPKRRPHSIPTHPAIMSTLEEQGYDGGHESGASTYDGDISSTNASTRRISPSHAQQGHSAAHYNSRAAGSTRPVVTNTYSSASTVSLGTESSPRAQTASSSTRPESEEHFLHPGDVVQPKAKAAFHAPAPHGMMARITAEELQRRMLENIDGAGPDGLQRSYKINKPPAGRPIRIYADGVYDLFHYAHALALRQAKLFFPDVYLLVGVVSDELVRQYKATPVLTSEERYESVRNCKWVDEVVEDAPWIIDANFIEQHKIDYVAHDEEPYQSAGSEDVYQFVKDRGQFIPTRRTSGISTSELLQRIVEGYRGGDYDSKLVKIGHPELCSEAGSVRSARSGRPASDEAQASRPPSVPPSPHNKRD